MTDPVVEADEIPRLANPRLLDVRDASAFETRPVEGARRVPVEAWIDAARSAEASFGNLGYWQDQIAALGLSDEDTAVVFDDGRMTEAARVWFVLQFFGARAVVVNGGWPALDRAAFARPAPSARADAAFTATSGAGRVGLVDRQALKDGLRETAVFDARTRQEFDGSDLRKNARGGHLPGARSLPHEDLLEGGRLRPAAALRALMEAAGFRSGDRIVTHCDGGGRAALAAIAAVRAGLAHVEVYYLSFSDWAKDESCPIER